MNIHEYQAKKLLKDYKIPISSGFNVNETDDLNVIYENMDETKWVVKAQIHAGGRGKGKFIEKKAGSNGGVRISSNKKEAIEECKKMLGSTLVTKQTGNKGKKVSNIFFEKVSEIKNEFYLAFVINREKSCISIICSPEGGMDIEEIASKSPEKIRTIFVNSSSGISNFHGREVAFFLNLKDNALRECEALIINLYNLSYEKNCEMIEINPLILNNKNSLICLDCKMSFDSNSLFKNKDISSLRDETEEDPRELLASKFDLNYISLDGEIGCMVNGAGLAMATMDIIKLYGSEPANFLDVGGGASKEKVTEAFKLITSDKKVKGILINIFGGIMRCDIIAEGVILAVKEIGLKVPLVVRLEGTNVDKGKKLLQDSSFDIISAENLNDAAIKIVEAVKS